MAAVLLVAYPICLADQAIAAQRSTSYSSSAFERSGLLPARTVSAASPLLPPRTSPGQSLLPSGLPSSRQVDALQSELDDRRGELALLKKSTPLDPKNKAAVDALVTSLEAEVSDLSTELASLRRSYARLTAAQDAAARARDEYAAAQTAESVALANLETAGSRFRERQDALTAATERVTSARTALDAASAELVSAAVARDAAQRTRDDAYAAAQLAQTDYDTLLVSQPGWVAPTEEVQVPYEVRVPYQVFTGSQQGQELNDPQTAWGNTTPSTSGSTPSYNTGTGTLQFTFVQATVTKTFTGSFGTDQVTFTADVYNNNQNNAGRGADTYSYTITAYDNDDNVVATRTYNSQGWHDTQHQTLSVTPTSTATKIKVSITGFDAGYWYAHTGPVFTNISVQGMKQTTTTEYRTETRYRTEIRPVQTTGTVQVDVGEGGQATFTAPAGATFTGSTLRYESYGDPSCGAAVQPDVSGRTSVTVAALNSVWGDPCGGQGKHLVGTLTYSGAPTAPMVKDPALATVLATRQRELTAAETELTRVTATWTDVSAVSDDAKTALASVTTAETTASTQFDEAVAARETATTTYSAARVATVDATTSVEVADAEVATTAEIVTTSYKSTAARTATVATRLEEPKTLLAQEPEPEPVPEPETGSTDLPAEITADSLLETDLSKVDPAEMTPEQADALKEAALVVFETAEPGSPEYEQALDALYLAAEQDDIVLDANLAAVPGVAALVDAINFLGNAGADMSPVVREKSKKVVVSAVVAVGTAVQAAAGVAASAAASSSSASSSRRTK